MDNGKENDATIYQIVLKGQTPLGIVIEEWIESYKLDKKSALKTLLQFLFDSSGCKGKVSECFDDQTSLIRDLTKDFNEDMSDYPLSHFGVKWRRFRSGFCEFLEKMIKICQNCIIYDGYMMSNIISLLAALSDSQVRAFRHTSTLASMKIMTSLIDVQVSVSTKYSVSRRQYRLETKKPPERRNNDRIEHLASVNKEFEENLDTLDELIMFLFKAVFVIRYRDTVPAIREICISEVGMWFIKNPMKFLDDLHLKYVGWSLSDRNGGVRMKAVQCLIPLYETAKYVERLEVFIHKFKDRIVSMTRDIDSEVAAETLKLVKMMLINEAVTFKEDELNEMFKLMYSSVSEVAHKSGELFCSYLECKIESITDDLHALPNVNPLFIKYLLQYHLKCKLHSHASYLVNAILPCCKAITDWKSMTNLLLDVDRNFISLSTTEEKAMIEMMLCSINQVYTGTPPIGRQIKKIQTLKMLKQSKDNINKIGVHFIAVLPALINKYGSDGEVLSWLLEIPQYFDLTILVLYPSLVDSLELLLSKLKDIVEIHHNTDILEKCCKIIESLCNKNHRISFKAETFKNVIIDSIAMKYHSRLSEWSQVIEGLDNDISFSLTDSLLKISVFYSVFDLGNWNLWDDMFNFLNEVFESRIAIPEDCVKNCLVACYYNILWDLKNFEEKSITLECNSGLNFKNRLLQFIDSLKRFIAHSDNQACSEEAYIIFCDLLIIMKNCSKNLRLPSYSASNAQKILETFVENQIFSKNVDDDFVIGIDEDLYKKRIMLASYCKLFTFHILPVYFISHLLKYYITSFNNYGDVLKFTIITAKKIDNVDCARAVISALMATFEESTPKLIIEKDTYSIKNLKDIKELAKQLLSLLVTSKEDCTPALYTLHKDGILFALRKCTVNLEGVFKASYHVLFFEVLLEFCQKLSKSNRVKILTFLNSKIPSKNITYSSHLQPLFAYKNGLSVGVIN